MKSKSSTGPESNREYDRPNGDEKFIASTAVTPSQTMGGWPGSRSADMRNTLTDLDLTHG